MHESPAGAVLQGPTPGRLEVRLWCQAIKVSPGVGRTTNVAGQNLFPKTGVTTVGQRSSQERRSPTETSHRKAAGHSVNLSLNPPPRGRSPSLPAEIFPPSRGDRPHEYHPWDVIDSSGMDGVLRNNRQRRRWSYH